MDENFNADDKGCSLVLVNTEKGRKLFNKVKSQMNLRVSDKDTCLQPNLQHPSEIHPKRMMFEKDYARKGFEYVAYKYGDIGWRYKLKVLKRKCHTAIKQILNK